jgi:hypothetical protein
MTALYKNMILLLCLSTFISCAENSPSVTKNIKVDYTDKFQEAKKYCIDNGLNTDFFLMADMSIHSGKKRFFLVEFNEGIIDSFMVSHGCCNYPWSSDFSKSDPTFSNVPNSHCSSLGKYIIGERGVSNWGVRVKYLLHGKDATNSNALSRDIVFHSWEEITDEEIYPDGTAEGWGCPALSNNAFLYIDKKLQSNPKKTLLWMIG